MDNINGVIGGKVVETGANSGDLPPIDSEIEFSRVNKKGGFGKLSSVYLFIRSFSCEFWFGICCCCDDCICVCDGCFLAILGLACVLVLLNLDNGSCIDDSTEEDFREFGGEE